MKSPQNHHFIGVNPIEDDVRVPNKRQTPNPGSSGHRRRTFRKASHTIERLLQPRLKTLCDELIVF
jgi:hypothetical protein